MTLIRARISKHSTFITLENFRSLQNHKIIVEYICQINWHINKKGNT